MLEFVENCEIEPTCSFDLAMAMCSESVPRPSQRVQVNLQGGLATMNTLYKKYEFLKAFGGPGGNLFHEEAH